jgi:MoaA/NifB/PqqE/SkfB family radical SAM enzyme
MILSGGEVTFMSNWRSIIERLWSQNFSVMMITNVAKIMSDKEIETLALLNQILISIDTPDHELAKIYRSKTQLENIVYNIVRIRSYCAATDRATPPMTFHCTLGAQTVRSLPELVSLAYACGVPHIHINEVTMHGDFQFEYKPVTYFTEKNRAETINIFNSSFALAQKLGVRVSVVDGLIDAIQNPSSEEIQSTQTRLCFDPWRMLLIGVDGAFTPVAMGTPP